MIFFLWMKILFSLYLKKVSRQNNIGILKIFQPIITNSTSYFCHESFAGTQVLYKQ